MPSNPLDAYKSVETASLNGRELEASVLAKAAALLAAVQQNWSASDRDVLLEDALRFNQQLWTLFQTEVATDDNLLPVDIKRNLLSLSAFVDKRTYDIISYPDPAKLDILISINNNIAAGLRTGTDREP